MNLTEGGISHLLIEVLNDEIIAIVYLNYSQNHMEIVKINQPSQNQFLNSPPKRARPNRTPSHLRIVRTVYDFFSNSEFKLTSA